MQKVQFVRVSPISGKTNTMILEVDPERLEQYDNGKLTIQAAFPHLDPDSREFIKTGITSDEWADIWEGSE
jgi:hypothetical protein